MIRVAINGCGRIGRIAFREMITSRVFDVVAINDLSTPEEIAHLIKYDTIHRSFHKNEIGFDENNIIISGKKKIRVFKEMDPINLPWQELNIDLVLECTGKFTDYEGAFKHITSGAKKVLISAPGKGDMKTIVNGVNNDKLDGTEKIVSASSCTTNCLAPVLNVLDKKFGIINGWMTTVHAYTGDQQLLDKNHKDFRRARAANLSMIPTSTGAAKAIGLVLPRLAGKLDGMAIRVPTPDVSVVELVVNLERDATVDAVNAAMRAAESKTFGYNELPLVSIDFTHDAHSSIFDAGQTKVLGDKLVHVTAWYDNEWGFSNRMGDTAVAMGKLIK